MSVTVRRAGPEDVAALASLRWGWRVDEAGEEPAGTAAQYIQTMSDWWASHPGHVAVLAQPSDAPEAVGMAWLAMGDRVPSPAGLRPRSAWVQSVYVRPDHRDRGIGRGMLGFVADVARTENCAYLAVHPSPRSTSLYERCGYPSSDGLLELRLDSAGVPRERGGQAVISR